MISNDSLPVNNSPVTAEENVGVTEKPFFSSEKLSGINFFFFLGTSLVLIFFV